MFDNFIKELVVVAVSIVGLAIIATLVSNRANTANVITSAGNAFSNAIAAATGPVSGGGLSLAGLNSFNGLGSI